MLKNTIATLALGAALFTGPLLAADYVIDRQGQHAFINFKISHLGYSWLYGSFKDFSGTFSYDEKNPDTSKVQVSIQTSSVDTNQAERDNHLRSDDFLNVSKFPTATFESTAIKTTGEKSADITGNLTLNGVTKPVVIKAKLTGEGADPWGGYRAGFEGSTSFKLKDFNIKKDLGPASQEVELTLSVEGVRQ